MCERYFYHISCRFILFPDNFLSCFVSIGFLQTTIFLFIKSDNENLPTGSYDRNACLRESDVFDTTDNLRNTWRYYDTQGIPFTLSVTSDCESGRGIDDSDSAGYTLYRLYEVDDSGSTTEFECIHSEKTECKEESDGKLTKTFQRLDGSKRYLFVATGSIELVTVCDVSDDCTTEFDGQ